MKNKIIIYGGSFDPPHIAHEKISNYVYSLFKPYKFIILPCYKQALKDKHYVKPIDRFKMLKLAFSNEKFEISKYELDKENKNYSIDSLNYFKWLYQKADVYFLMGLDSFLNIMHWKNYIEILNKFKLIVVSRKNDKNKSLKSFNHIYRKLFFCFISNYKNLIENNKNNNHQNINNINNTNNINKNEFLNNFHIIFINSLNYKISSSIIRIKNKKEFLNKKVYDYIKDNNLYDEIY